VRGDRIARILQSLLLFCKKIFPRNSWRLQSTSHVPPRNTCDSCNQTLGMTKLPAHCVPFQDTHRLGWWPYCKKTDTFIDSGPCWVVLCTVGLVSRSYVMENDVSNAPKSSALKGLVHLFLRLPFHSPTKLRPDTVRLLYGHLVYLLTTNYSHWYNSNVILLDAWSGQNTFCGFWDGFHTFLTHCAQYSAMELWHIMGTFPATGLLLAET